MTPAAARPAAAAAADRRRRPDRRRWPDGGGGVRRGGGGGAGADSGRGAAAGGRVGGRIGQRRRAGASCGPRTGSRGPVPAGVVPDGGGADNRSRANPFAGQSDAANPSAGTPDATKGSGGAPDGPVGGGAADARRRGPRPHRSRRRYTGDLGRGQRRGQTRSGRSGDRPSGTAALRVVFSRRRAEGVLWGMSVAQLVLAVAALFLVVAAVGGRPGWGWWLLAAAVLVVLIVVPVRGRSLADVGPALAVEAVMRMLGWHIFRGGPVRREPAGDGGRRVRRRSADAAGGVVPVAVRVLPGGPGRAAGVRDHRHRGRHRHRGAGGDRHRRGVDRHRDGERPGRRVRVDAGRVGPRQRPGGAACRCCTG